MRKLLAFLAILPALCLAQTHTNGGGSGITSWSQIVTAQSCTVSGGIFIATDGTCQTFPSIGTLTQGGLIYASGSSTLASTAALTGLVKANGASAPTAATVSTDYLGPVAGVVDAGNAVVTNISHLGVGYSGTPDVVARFVGDNGAFSRIVMRGYSNDASASSIRVAKFRGTIGSPLVPQSGDSLGSFQHSAYSGISADAVAGAYTKGTTTETWTTSANGAKMGFYTTPNGSTTQTLALELQQDQSANFANTVNATTFVGALTGNASGTAANVTGTVAIANGGTGATTQIAAARALKSSQVLFPQSGTPFTAVTAPGDTNANALITYTVPILSANDVIHCTGQSTVTNNSNVKTFAFLFGGTSITSRNVASMSGAQFDFSIGNRNATNSQVGWSFWIDSGGSGRYDAPGTAAIDTTAATTLVLQMTKATAGDSVVVNGMRCTLESVGS